VSDFRPLITLFSGSELTSKLGPCISAGQATRPPVSNARAEETPRQWQNG
jgi:hypothetical protein